jgi:hypothetical protein
LVPGAIYYAIAILYFFEEEGTENTCLIGEVTDHFKGTSPLQLSEEPLLTNSRLLESALGFLSKAEAIELDEDEYAPPIITFKSGYGILQRSELPEADGKIVARFLKAGDRRYDWLTSALANLKNKVANDSADTSSDVTSIEAEDNWSPLPLDRGEQELRKVIENIDSVIEQARADNGYSATEPEERKFVLDKLQPFLRTLKEETSISWTYVKEFGIRPLVILGKRFLGAGTGLFVEAAKSSLKEWLKKRGLSFLDEFF